MNIRKIVSIGSKDSKDKLNEFKSRCKKHEQARKKTNLVGVFATFKNSVFEK